MLRATCAGILLGEVTRLIFVRRVTDLILQALFFAALVAVSTNRQEKDEFSFLAH